MCVLVVSFPPQHLILSEFKIFFLSLGFEIGSTVFLLPFPKVEHPFCMFLGHLCFCDVYIQVLCLFLSFLFFLLIFKSSLFILYTNYLLVDGLQISSPNL